MQTQRRKALAVVFTAFAATIGSLSGAAYAQGTYPTKAIRLIVPYTPGGVTDTSGRLIADQMSKRLGQQIIVENKPGASGNIGTVRLPKQTQMATPCYSALTGQWLLIRMCLPRYLLIQ